MKLIVFIKIKHHHPALNFIEIAIVLAVFYYFKSIPKTEFYIQEKIALKNKVSRHSRPDIAAQMYVVNIAKSCFDNYYANAWSFDVYDPIFKKALNIYDESFSFLFTMIDSMDSLVLMGLHDKISKIKGEVINLNFQVNVDIPCLPFSRRIIGGLLGMYYIDRSPIFLDKAVEFMDSFFDVLFTNSIPNTEINLRSRTVTSQFRDLSDLTNFQIELTQLSFYTKNAKYKIMLGKIRNKFLHSIRKSEALIFQNNTDPVGLPRKLSKGAIKYIQMLITLQKIQKDEMTMLLISNSLNNIINSYILKNKSNDLYALSVEIGVIDQRSCDLGGVLIQASKLVSSRSIEYTAVARELVKTCYKMFTRQSTGLTPKRVIADTFEPIKNFEMFTLQPKLIESLYYMYQSTKEIVFRDMSLNIIRSIDKHCNLGNGYAGLLHVGDPDLGHFGIMDSKFMSEILKYLYLTFSGHNDYYVNLGGHFILIHEDIDAKKSL
eukprot:NODE_106_length_19857_cov_0.799980.p2 type:complete len:490 gc:universal NODE_106_length_19857_cov_0.799980:16283-14814(-)